MFINFINYFKKVEKADHKSDFTTLLHYYVHFFNFSLCTIIVNKLVINFSHVVAQRNVTAKNPPRVPTPPSQKSV